MNAAVRRERDSCAHSVTGGPERPRAAPRGEQSDDHCPDGGEEQQHPVVSVWMVVTGLRIAEREEHAEADRRPNRTHPFTPTQPLVEPGTEDENKKDDLADHHRLNGGKVPERQRERLQKEASRRQRKSGEPNRAPKHTRHEPVSYSRRRANRLDPESLEDGREGVRHRRGKGEDDGHRDRYSRWSRISSSPLSLRAAVRDYSTSPDWPSKTGLTAHVAR